MNAVAKAASSREEASTALYARSREALNQNDSKKQVHLEKTLNAGAGSVTMPSSRLNSSRNFGMNAAAKDIHQHNLFHGQFVEMQFSLRGYCLTILF